MRYPSPTHAPYRMERSIAWYCRPTRTRCLQQQAGSRKKTGTSIWNQTNPSASIQIPIIPSHPIPSSTSVLWYSPPPPVCLGLLSSCLHLHHVLVVTLTHPAFLLPICLPACLTLLDSLSKVPAPNLSLSRSLTHSSSSSSFSPSSCTTPTRKYRAHTCQPRRHQAILHLASTIQHPASACISPRQSPALAGCGLTPSPPSRLASHRNRPHPYLCLCLCLLAVSTTLCARVSLPGLLLQAEDDVCPAIYTGSALHRSFNRRIASRRLCARDLIGHCAQAHSYRIRCQHRLELSSPVAKAINNQSISHNYSAGRRLQL